MPTQPRHSRARGFSYDDLEEILLRPYRPSSLRFFADLGQKYEVMPKGIIDWGTTPKDFFEGKTAIMWTTTGNLTNVRKNAKFAFGVAALPSKQRGGSPTGGGNIYIFKTKDKVKQAAALEFARFLTTPERAADWSIATGYVATRPDAWQTEAMKKYAAEFLPAVVARDQLKDAVAELSTRAAGQDPA